MQKYLVSELLEVLDSNIESQRKIHPYYNHEKNESNKAKRDLGRRKKQANRRIRI